VNFETFTDRDKPGVEVGFVKGVKILIFRAMCPQGDLRRTGLPFFAGCEMLNGPILCEMKRAAFKECFFFLKSGG